MNNKPNAFAEMRKKHAISLSFSNMETKERTMTIVGATTIGIQGVSYLADALFDMTNLPQLHLLKNIANGASGILMIGIFYMLIKAVYFCKYDRHARKKHNHVH